MDKNPEYLVKKAKKALKKGILKWSRDYSSAAMYLDEAAKIYEIQKQYKKVG